MTATRRVARLLSTSGVLFLTALTAGAVCSVGFLGIGDSHTISACFQDVDGLVGGGTVGGNEVRIAGVQVGTVSSVQVGTQNDNGNADCDTASTAYVTMTIDSAHWPLHAGTTVAVVPKGVLSNVYVAVTPGPAGNPSLGGDPYFPLAQTQSPVNLDELSNVFTPSVTESIRTQLQEGILVFAGAGTADLNQTIENADPLTADAISVSDVLATRSPQLDALNFEFDTITGDLSRENDNLRPLIANLDTLLGALAAREYDLQGTLVHAADVLSDIDQGLSSSKTQSDLERIFQTGPQALTCAGALAGYLTPVITQVNPHIVSLNTLLSEFITATGFNSNTMNGVDSLRIDPTLPPSSPEFTGSESGGLAQEHHTTHFEEGGPLQLPAALGNGCAP